MAIRDFPGCRPVHARLAIRDDSKNRGQRKKHSEGIWKKPENGVEKKEPQKPNDSNGFRGSNPGGEYEIRTREAVTPTRFPSVRHRPLGESSITLFAAAFWPQQTTRREYHRLADKQNRRVLCVCRAWRLARPGSLRRSDARIQ